MKRLTYSGRKAMYGRAFISIWAIGVLLFFILPFIKTLIYSFNDVSTGSVGLVLEPLGLDNYVRIFTKDAEFLPLLTSSLTSLLYRVPLVVAFSLFIAVMVNRKFIGRTFFRAVFFLPVVVLSGSIMILFKSDVVAAMLFSSDDSGTKLFEGMTILTDFLSTFGFGEKLLGILQSIVGMVLDVCWDSGVQYLLYLAALQGIPMTLYEAARVEGATKWDEFWKITFPSTRPTLFLCVIYTIVTSTQGSGVVGYVKTQAFTKFDYGYASSIAMIYLVICLVLVGIVSWILRKWVEAA